ncbi:phosphoenolpyruvate--protein phosphotransferase [Phytoactinopolyspora halotolerans]|uniref:Phosphoenolpyruvate-protein phosphotransferase n=1 Tax=Phytoactinopolyspora halotolerans TaxID=1981512 RepID=A0A6L9SCE7_9ACTN|nr:putative PEP-binding protein [Phytoactinopolyspora halotolerans]NEE02747.1 phosphoenolpyruvate--protein phosphotransferase [Phytoactinopolyspora halotolerans]
MLTTHDGSDLDVEEFDVTAEAGKARTDGSGVALHGIGVSAGIAVGPVARMADPVRPPVDEPAAVDAAAAREEIAAALEGVAAELDRRAGLTDASAAEILTATAMMARDPSLLTGAERRLNEGIGPANALDQAVEEVCASLEAVGGYLAERVTDLRDVRDRVVAHLLGAPQPGVPELHRPSVLVAHDLAPADTVGLSPATVLAIVTEAGGPTSHTAILAAQLGIPAVVGVARVEQPDATVEPDAAAESGGPTGTGAAAETGAAAGAASGASAPTRQAVVRALLTENTLVAVDGASGEIVVEPDESVREAWTLRAGKRQEQLARFSGPGRTRDGAPVALLANIGTADDAQAAAAAADVEGVGLFRTEFLYLDRPAAPTVEEQTETYLAVLRAFGTRRVVVRTLDAGADKPLAFAPAEGEENPALGVRGLRLGRRTQSLLEDQLTALAAAARQSEADVWVMAPMVATADEARWFAVRARAAGLPKVGVMVEVPSAALRAEQVLAEVDFASIGTNDLAQYTLAADRMLGELATLLDPWQPAVLDLIAATGHGAAGTTPVGVCGEAAGDPILALVLVGLGASSLSMAPAKIPAVRAALAMHDRERCVQMAAAARAAADPAAARSAVVDLLEPEALALA